MAETITIARPYARAAFELARDAGALPAWSDMLAFAAAAARDPSMAALLDSPRIGAQEMASLFIDVCQEQLSDEGRNFIRLLAANHRMRVLPEIAQLYEALRADAESRLEARLISAFPVSAAQRDAIAASLKARLGRDVILQCETDNTLLGGAIIRAGDLVIDGSVRGRLEKLAGNLSH